MGALTLRRTYLVAFAVLVTVFVAFYPYLGAMGHCGDHGEECPYAAQSSHTTSAGFMATCLSAALAVSSVAVLALSILYRRRVIGNDTRPVGVFLSLDPPPPRLSLSR